MVSLYISLAKSNVGDRKENYEVFVTTNLTEMSNDSFEKKSTFHF